MTNKNKAPTDNITEGALEARSDDDPDTVLRMMQDDQGDIWLSLCCPEKGMISFRACTLQGGGRNLDLRRVLQAALQNAQSDHIDTYPWDEVADNICKRVAGMTIEEETISVTMKVDTFRRCIREALKLGLQQNAQSVDVEDIKREINKSLAKKYGLEGDSISQHGAGILNDTIDHLDAQGYLHPKPKEDAEALAYFEKMQQFIFDNHVQEGDMTDMDEVAEHEKHCETIRQHLRGAK